MNAAKLSLWCGRSSVAACLAIWLCLTLVFACSSEDAMPEVETVDSAEVGKTLRAQGWVVTLIEQPETRKEVGSAEAGGMGGEAVTSHFQAYGFTSVAQTEDLWLILGVELTKCGEGD